MLLIMSRPPKPPPDFLGNCYISMLPDELLAEIFAYLPPEPYWCYMPTYDERPPIPVICKHWERIYDATLYRNLSFYDHCTLARSRTSRVVKRLQERLDLRNHVRSILVQVYNPSEATCRLIFDTIKSCQAARTVSLYLDWSEKDWPIIQAVETLPRLEVLQLSGYKSGPSLQMILRHFNQPTLRDIRLSQYGLGKGDLPKASWLPIDQSSQDEMDIFSLLARSHTSAMTSLKLNNPSALPHCSKTLLEWPSTLIRLSLSQLTNSAYGSHYTLDLVEPILSIHCESLQHITVGIIPGKQEGDGSRTTSGIPDFSKFPRLRELHLSAYNIMEEKPSEAAAKLAAPMLRHLAMEFYTDDEHFASREDFAEDEVLWMAGFASQYLARETDNSLESVFVDFQPINDFCSLYDSEDMTWPWEYLRRAEKEMSRCKVVLKYSKPGCTKDEWDQAVADNWRRRNRKLCQG